MTLISLQQVISSHFGKVIVEQVMQIIWEYDFQKKLGYFVLDNTTSNNIYIEAILIDV